jgi:hypothetical protein
MILNNAPANEAVLSNVGEIGEFRIRNSAKAFNILSSGLYANKIKAIIRELSCNAVDSHVAAGKADVPFEVHMPNSLDPYFSIRDFGTGLSHEQVTQIYTTYFESTKTASNEFIGALGLGSKSPFSYTDNFTVTAIKDGTKGIYSAFINGEGVPSIALMMTEETDEPSGVEIKFSVNDRYDFSKFRDEAQSVYQYFKLQPVVTGDSNFTIPKLEYETVDLIQGVHVRAASRQYRHYSVAVMGNIAYPIEVPNSKQLGSLASMLECGLEIHFGIGEVDFQASREGLSYIPQTVESIKAKLEAVSTALAERIKTDAEAIDNLWDRAIFLEKKNQHSLWHSSVQKYVTANPLPTVDATGNRWGFLKTFKIPVDELASKYNIAMTAFSRTRGSSTCNLVKANSDHERGPSGGWVVTTNWSFHVSDDSDFVINDTNVGAGERAKYHYRQLDLSTYQRTVYVMQKADAGKEMDTDQFFADISNPPEHRRLFASDLTQKPRKDSSVGRNVSILGMEKRKRGYSDDRVVWVDAGKLSEFDSTKTHYYVPLTGYTVISDHGITDAKLLQEWMKSCGIGSLSEVRVYGVRKTDLEDVKKQANWVNVEKFIEQSLGVPDINTIMNMSVGEIEMFDFVGGRYGDNMKFDHSGVQDGSPFKNFIQKFDGYKRVHFSEYALRQLYSAYGKKVNFDLGAAVKAIISEFADVKTRYPLLDSIGNKAPKEAVVEYVNLIDNVKGI